MLAMKVAAFVIAVVGLLVAGVALSVSLRRARAAERSATAAKDSPKAANVSAGAATRSADTAEQGLDIEMRRADAEERQRREAAAPRIGPVRDHRPGTFNLHGDDPRFPAHLRNVGGSTAVVQSARLRHVGGETCGLLRSGESNGVAEDAPTLDVAQGEHVILNFESPEIEILRTTIEPLELEVSDSSPAGHSRHRLRLGRLLTDRTGRMQWRVIPEG